MPDRSRRERARASARERNQREFYEAEGSGGGARRDERRGRDGRRDEGRGRGQRAASTRGGNGGRGQRPAKPAKEPRKKSDLPGRILVAIPAAVLAIGFVHLGGIGWTALAAVMGGACVIELYRMLEKWHPASAVGVLVVVGMCFAAQYGGERAMTGVGLAGVLVTFLAVMNRGDAPRPTMAIAATLLGVMWIGFAVAHGVLLRDLPHGAGLTIDVLVGTFVADTCAYFGGRLFGHRKLAPSISPNKTVEGLLFGMVAAILAVFCAGLYQPWLPHGTAMLLGFTIAVTGPLGDLFESMLKRDAGTKDAGNLFGAHGGALDRLDAMSFTIVACYYVWVASGH